MSIAAYGVDVKIPEDSVKLIEINGCDFGTDFFKYEEGLGFYRTFMQALATQTNGKPIFLPKSWFSPIDSLEIESEIRYNQNLVSARKELFEIYKQIMGDLFYLDGTWLEDALKYETETVAKLPDAESRFFYEAGVSLGLPVKYFDALIFHGESIEIFLEGESQIFDPKDIGIIWADSGIVMDTPNKYQDLFISDAFTESVLSSKSLTRFIFSEDELGRFFPHALSVGLGVGNLTELLNFLSSSNSELIAVKNDTGSQGVGTFIKDRVKLLNQLNTKSRPFNIDSYVGVMRYIIESSMRGFPHELALNIFEDFVPSIPILSSATGKYHDGCARVIVLSPENGDPYAIDTQWRLSPSPISDMNQNLNSRYRANLSRGAYPEIVEPEHKYLMEELAVKSVKSLEEGLSRESDELVPYALTENKKILHVLRSVHYAYCMNDVAMNHGLIQHRDQEINLTPFARQEELRIEDQMNYYINNFVFGVMMKK